MKKIPFTNFAVFVLFFGLALIEAVRDRDWLKASIFAALGLLSLRVDLRERSK